MYFKKYMGRVVLWIWAELSYKLGPSWQGPSFMWAELAWAELSVIRLELIIQNARRYGLN